MFLADDHIHALCAAVVELRIDRQALLAAIDKELVSRLPVETNHARQIRSDVVQLNKIGRLPDGTVPLVTWVINALHLAGPSSHAVTIEKIWIQLNH